MAAPIRKSIVEIARPMRLRIAIQPRALPAGGARTITEHERDRDEDDRGEDERDGQEKKGHRTSTDSVDNGIRDFLTATRNPIGSLAPSGREMSNLIVGSVTPTSVRLWARGEKKSGRREDPLSSRGRLRSLAEPDRRPRALPRLHGGLRDRGLAPATAYECQLSYSKPGRKPPLVRNGTFTTAPETPRDIAFLLASCNYANLELLTSKVVDVAWERIGALATAESADFMIHCGDQIYGDLPGVEFPTLLDYQEKYQRPWGHSPRPASWPSSRTT
jgi:hypothetical protein